MKTIWYLALISALTSLSVSPALAQSWGRYGTFKKSKRIDRALFRAYGRGGLDSTRRIVGRSLSLSTRGEGKIGVSLAPPADLYALQVVAEIRDEYVPGCGPGDAAALIISGRFFNSGTGDVMASIHAVRTSTFTEPRTFKVEARVEQCLDLACSTRADLVVPQQMGTMYVESSATLRLQWNPDDDHFEFQQGWNAELELEYSVDDGAPPLRDTKLVYVETTAECGAVDTSEMRVEARIHDLSVFR
jgi:hypothetical protein